MKKNYSLFSFQWLFLSVLALAATISCTKIDNSVKEANLPRQFTPGDISIDKTQTVATLSWSHVFSTKATTYTIQLSQDSTFSGTPVFEKVIDSNQVTLTDSVLQPRQIYFARVKANAIGSSSESSWVTSSRFSISGEQIFHPLAVSDVIDNGVLLKWNPTDGLTTIVLTKLTDNTTKTINLSAADLTANQRIITGLSSNTRYSVE